MRAQCCRQRFRRLCCVARDGLELQTCMESFLGNIDTHHHRCNRVVAGWLLEPGLCLFSYCARNSQAQSRLSVLPTVYQRCEAQDVIHRDDGHLLSSCSSHECFHDCHRLLLRQPSGSWCSIAQKRIRKVEKQRWERVWFLMMVR